MKGLNSPDKENISPWAPGIKGMGNPSKSKIGFSFHDHHQLFPGPSIIFHISYFHRILETYCLFNLKTKLKYKRKVWEHLEDNKPLIRSLHRDKRRFIS